ncbi:MAG TPA: hypothetical protein PLP84_03390 [Acholeplasmataceae bacterium]|jgi:hypothetical protein|nr:hypothetical protein [Acholeplasmataceae bacterium]
MTIDIALTILIFAIILLSHVVVLIWKKKHFVKQLYIERAVSIIGYLFSYLFSVSLVIICFSVGKDSLYSWICLLIILVFDIIMMFVYVLTSTTCIYVEGDILYSKNLFKNKQIKIDKEVIVTEEIDKRIVKSKDCDISINSRYLSGSIWILLDKIYQIKESKSNEAV